MAVEAEGTKEGPVTFHVDSTYAIKIATGEWRPRQRNAMARNGRLVRRVRNAYRDLTLARGAENIRIVHERAHVWAREATRQQTASPDEGRVPRMKRPHSPSSTMPGPSASRAAQRSANSAGVSATVLPPCLHHHEL